MKTTFNVNYTKFCIFSLISIFIIIVGMGGIVGAVSCPAGWTFIDKQSYNVCYLSNVTDIESLNITDNNNNTILSYQSSYYQMLGTTVTKRVNYSDINNKFGIDYLTFKYYDDNISIDGLIYFNNNTITISEKRDIYKNTTVQRSQWKVYNYTDFYWKSDDPTVYRINGTNSIATENNINYFYGENNFTIIHAGIRNTYLNKTDIYYPNNRNINVSFKHGINLTGDITGTIMLTRNNGLLEFKFENTQTIENTNSTFLDSNHVTEILFGNNENGIFNDSYQNIRNLYGLISNYAICGSTTYSSACGHWDILTSLIYNLYDFKIWNNNLTNEIVQTALLHTNLIYMDETNLNNTLTAGYDFNMPIIDLPSMNHNAWNNTHTRLVGDLLNQLSVYKKLNLNSLISDNMSNSFINYLQLNKNNNFILGVGIHHSTNTKDYYGNQTPINILSIGTTSLINAYQAGYSINQTILNIYLNTLKNYTNFMFNETAGYNDSYYSYGEASNYYSKGYRYLSFSYVLAEQFDGRIAYMFTKDNIFRENMTNKKINEMIYKWNGTQITHRGGNITNVYCDIMIYYQNLSVLAFEYKDKNFITTPMYCTSYFKGWNNVPNERRFMNLIYPTFLTKENTTFFVDEEDNLMFETPTYAMIPDFHYNNNLTGMVIYNKWAYNTNGNFSNLSTSPYKYFYSPQHGKMINYSEQLSWKATNNVENMWTGNLSDSVNFKGNNSDKIYLYSDNELLGEFNSSIKNEHETAKTIKYDLLTSALLTNGTSTCNGSSSTLSQNTGNVNITLNPSEACWVLDDYNLTEGVSRDYSPIWISSKSNSNGKETYHIASNISTVSVPVYLNIISTCSEVNKVTYTPSGQSAQTYLGEQATNFCNSLKNGEVLQIGKSSSSNELELESGSTSMSRTVLKIVMGMLALLVLCIAVGSFFLYIYKSKGLSFLSNVDGFDMIKFGVVILICVILASALIDYIGGTL